MDIYLTDDRAINNIFGEDVQVPRAIPFYLKELKIKSTNHTALVIAIYVGKFHYSFLSTLITKALFEDIELVPLSARRSNKTMFTQRLQLHKFLCQDSGAIKLRNTSYKFRDSIKTDLRNDKQVKEHIIDIAEASSTSTNGTLYIQCMTLRQDIVIQRVEEYITNYTFKNPGDNIPEILTCKTSATSTSASETQTINTWTTRFQTYFADKRASTSEPHQTKKSNVPGPISYSDMAAGLNINSMQYPPPTHTALSLPTNS